MSSDDGEHKEHMEFAANCFKTLGPEVIAGIANGTVSVVIEYVEICKDDDDWPVIRPRIVINGHAEYNE